MAGVRRNARIVSEHPVVIPTEGVIRIGGERSEPILRSQSVQSNLATRRSKESLLLDEGGTIGNKIGGGQGVDAALTG
jgi:hypothetical protein